MPIFNFICKNQFDIHNGEYYQFEEIQFKNEIVLCPICKSETEKIFSPPSSIKFIGSGWTEKSRNINYDTTSGIKEQVQELKKQKDNYTTEELFNPKGNTPI